jgi:hypothetical protein
MTVSSHMLSYSFSKRPTHGCYIFWDSNSVVNEYKLTIFQVQRCITSSAGMALNKEFRKIWKIVNYLKAIFQNFLG